MFKQRVRSTLRDPAWWVFIVFFILLLYLLLVQDVQSGGGLYTLSRLQKLSEQKGALTYFNERLFGTQYDSLEEFFSEFVPRYLEQASVRIIPEVASNSNAMAFVWLFPAFFITRRIQGVQVQAPILYGISRTRIFISCIAEFVFVTYLIFDTVAMLAVLPFVDNLFAVSPLLLFRLLALRPLLFLALCAPMVVISFLTQNMLLAGLFSFGAFVVETVLMFKDSLPYLDPLSSQFVSSWAAEESGFTHCWIIASLFFAIAVLISFFIFRIKDIRRD